ncbi:MAG: PAS domain-containing protein, partial [Lachnospiraceae bacterium]|nr:PAS domain-containing protein [Lachnospiraceae bacterium]
MTVEKNEIIPRILRDMNDGVLVVDMHGKIIFLNDKGYHMLGVDE